MRGFCVPEDGLRDISPRPPRPPPAIDTCCIDSFCVGGVDVSPVNSTSVLFFSKLTYLLSTSNNKEIFLGQIITELKQHEIFCQDFISFRQIGHPVNIWVAN